MKTRYIFAYLFLLTSLGFFAFRLADDPFETLLKKLSDYNETHPQEKVYLHLDKPYYAIGDNIWFKAYLKNSLNNEPSQISNALYAELIDEKDSVRKQIKLPVVAGISWGDFKLTDTLPEGNYRIRAYTQWMRNAGPDFFFDKTIKIGNAWANRVFTKTSYALSRKDNAEQVETMIRFTGKQGEAYAARPVNYEVRLKNKVAERGKAITNDKGEISFTFVNKQPDSAISGTITARLTMADKQEVVKSIPVNTTSSRLDVQFFPEGGNLVENIPVRIGVKSTSASGSGQQVSGTVADNDGNEVLSFTTNQLGMGSIMLNPQSGKTYTAKIIRKDNVLQNVPLPAALAKGYVLSINNLDSTKISAKVLLSESLLNQGNLTLVVQHNNNVLTVLRAKTEKQVSVFSFPKKDLPSGVIHFTLFTGDNVPVAERIIFIHHASDQIDISLPGLKPLYKTRENVAVEFTAKNEGKVTQGSFSIAVTNTAAITPDLDNESNILTSLLLTSDLKGYVEKPNYYLSGDTRQIREDTDNLMLTQGWSRFLWKNLMNEPVKGEVFLPEKTLQVSGLVTTPGGKPVAKSKVSLFSTSGGVFLLDTLTDVHGRFNFSNLAFGDSTKFVVQSRNAKNKNAGEIKLDVIPGQVVTRNKNTGDVEVNVNEAIQSYIRKSESYFDDLTKRGLLEHSYTLDQVNIVQQKIQAKNSSNLNGAGHADAIINAKDLSTCINLSQCLQGRVAGLIIRDGKAYLLRNQGIPMQIIVDGMNMEPDYLNVITPFDVETIEILKSVGNTSIYGSRGGGGILLITTKRGGGDLSYNRYAPGIITYAPKGYYAIREFYSPQYTPENTIQGTDRRSTVYWNPHVPADAQGKGKFNFYNTDEPGTYRIVIEGINADGQLARKVYTYEVK